MVGKAGVGRLPGRVLVVKRGWPPPNQVVSGRRLYDALRDFALAFWWWQSGAGLLPNQVVVGRRRYGFTGFSALRSPCFGAVLVSGGLVVAGSARVWGWLSVPTAGGFYARV